MFEFAHRFPFYKRSDSKVNLQKSVNCLVRGQRKDRRLKTWENEFVNGVNVWCNRKPGGPVVLFIHGACGTGKNGKVIGEAFDGRYRFFSPDLPGHGTSPSSVPLGEIGIEQYAEGIVPFCNLFKDEKVHLVTHSMG